MSELTFPQHGDFPDAAFWASLGGAPPTSAIVSGLSFEPDFVTSDLTVQSGKSILNRGAMETEHPEIKPPKTLTNTVTVAEIDQKTLNLVDNTVNHIFIDASVDVDDAPLIVSNSVNTTPSETSFKIGQVNTDNNTFSDQWYLLSDSGVLTFPNQSALDYADNERLDSGTIVYNRGEELPYIIA